VLKLVVVQGEEVVLVVAVIMTLGLHRGQEVEVEEYIGVLWLAVQGAALTGFRHDATVGVYKCTLVSTGTQLCYCLSCPCVFDESLSVMRGEGSE